MKPSLFLLCIIVFFINPVEARDFTLWGTDISAPNTEISHCKVQELQDNTIFSQVKITAFSYTFATDKTEYSCFYGQETDCFSRATEIISAKFGKALDVYSYNAENPFSQKAPFFNIWKYDKGEKHFVLMLFGSGEGMTLDVNHYNTEKQSNAFILSTIRSFHFSIKPALLNALEK